VVGLVLSGTVVACSSPGGGATPDSTTTTSTTIVEHPDDGVLRIGVLLPSSGDGFAIGQSARAAIRAAVIAANNGGGVNGNPVTLLVRDEGSDTTTAAVGLQQLLDSNIDALIGPASSNIAIALVPTIVESGVVACSPSASALALDDFPDNGLFVRTIASDSLQADAMARVIEQTGDTTAAIAYIDDGYGRPFEQALQSRLRARGIGVTASVGFSADDEEYVTEATRLTASGNGALALIGDPETGSRMLAELAAATKTDPRAIVLNDALREPWSLSLLGSVSEATRSLIVGVSPTVITENPELLAEITASNATATGLFASQAFDCANLIMLAADKTDSAQPSVFAPAIPDISSSGSSCGVFATCAELLAEGRSIDYSGADGLLEISDDGDVTTARFDVFSFDAQGRDVSIGSITVSSSGTSVGS
jgi:branched-chain amino acid transport system substrate-binding protein